MPKTKNFSVILTLIFALTFSLCSCSYGEIIEAYGKAHTPAGKNFTPAQAKALARRGAVLDLQRNLLIRSRRASSEYVSGFITGIVMTGEKWDGTLYTVTGYIMR